MKYKLDFESLIQEALKQWPEVIDVSELEQLLPDFSRYSVKGLGVLSDRIEVKYIGKENEIIWRDLHIAIFEVIHEAAKSVTKFEMGTIRTEAVRVVFERRLKKAASKSDLNWEPEDLILVESYFSQNPTRKADSRSNT